jgi:hypothetical protein
MKAASHAAQIGEDEATHVALDRSGVAVATQGGDGEPVKRDDANAAAVLVSQTVSSPPWR